MTRNTYGALTTIPEFCAELIAEAEKAGAYTTGIDSDKRGRGEAVNVDLYGYDEAQGLAVVQVRQCRFRPNRYPKVRKDYHLLGRTESGTVFAHPVDSPARSKRAMATPQGVVRFVLARVWGVAENELVDIVRQGDVALIPATLPAGAERLSETELILRDTHRLRAGELYRAGQDLYAAGRASLVHLRHQHATVQTYSGVRRIAVGYRAQTWAFSAPTAD